MSIESVRIKCSTSLFFKKSFLLYESAFPKNERRTLEQQITVFESEQYHFDVLIQDDALVGILCWWLFDDYRYIEHFAIYPHIRGEGVGRACLEQFIEGYDTPVVLEVDLPTDDIAKRRIVFYERQGFVLSASRYAHPSYQQGGDDVELCLMSHPTLMDDFQIETFIQKTHPVVHRNHAQRRR